MHFFLLFYLNHMSQGSIQNWRALNKKYKLPRTNSNNQLLVIGCNYHTTWQSHKAMRFILADIKDNKALLETRTTNNKFYTKIEDLIFIDSKHNKQKACEILQVKELNLI